MLKHLTGLVAAIVVAAVALIGTPRTAQAVGVLPAPKAAADAPLLQKVHRRRFRHRHFRRRYFRRRFHRRRFFRVRRYYRRRHYRRRFFRVRRFHRRRYYRGHRRYRRFYRPRVRIRIHF